MKTAKSIALMAILAAVACTPKPNPSNFHDFANNEKGAGLLVKYITNAKHPMQDRVKAMMALMDHKWDIQVLDALDKSKDKGTLAEAVEEKIVPIYTKLCKESNPNLEDLSYYRDQVFRTLEFVPSSKWAPFQKQIAEAVFGKLSLKSSAKEVKDWVSKRIMLPQLKKLGKYGARGALILIHHAFGLSKLAGYLLKLKDPKVNYQLFQQIKHITSQPDVKIPVYYLDIVGQVHDVEALEWLLDRALDDDKELDFRNYAFNVATNMIDHKVVKKDLPGVVKRLKLFLDYDDPDYRWSGVYYLVYVEGTKAMPMVMKALTDDNSYPDADEDPQKTMVDFCREVMFENGKPIPGAWEAIEKLLASRNKVHKALGLVCVKAGKDLSKIGLVKKYMHSKVKLDSVFGVQEDNSSITIGKLATNCVEGLQMIQQVKDALKAGKISKKDAKLKEFIILAILDKTGKDYQEWVAKDWAAQKKAQSKSKKHVKK